MSVSVSVSVSGAERVAPAEGVGVETLHSKRMDCDVRQYMTLR